MKSLRKFLTAEWKNILIFNYVVDPSLLMPFVPSGTELDIFEGNAYLSLVGFEFNRTRVCGIAVPFHQAFEEVNLRFYVRRLSKRGVVFIREFVPKRAVAAIAQLTFNENYARVPMSHRYEIKPGGKVCAEYAWGSRLNRCRMRIETEDAGTLPPEGSLGQFITEHYWGYAAQTDGGCLEYEVQHPQWSVRIGKHAEFLGNAGFLYGPDFARTLSREPDFALLVDGSPVTVFNPRRIW